MHRSGNGSAIRTRARFNFCRVTQLGLLRLLTHRAGVGSAVLTQRQAWRGYDDLITDFRVCFEDEPLTLQKIFKRHSEHDEVSPKRWTDDYLAAFAESAGLQLVPLDQALAARISDSCSLGDSLLAAMPITNLLQFRKFSSVPLFHSSGTLESDRRNPIWLLSKSGPSAAFCKQHQIASSGTSMLQRNRLWNREQ